MSTVSKIISTGLLFLAFTACKEKATDLSSIKEDDFLIQYIDSSVKPGDDFFKFATGNWMKNNPIPSSERRWGIANLVRNNIYDQIRRINDEASNNPDTKKNSNAQMIGDFWATGMDSAKIDQQNVTPLKPLLDKVDAIKTKDDLLAVIGDFQIYGGSPLFSPAIFQDEKNSEKFTLHFYQGGIGLPDRDYYFNNDLRTQNIRKEYKIHVKKMFMLLGLDEKNAGINSEKVFKIESDLAKASRKIEDMRDPYRNYNKMSVSDFTKLTPSISWDKFLTQINI